MAGQQLETGACDLKVANSSLAATENLEAEAVAASASSEWEVCDAGKITHSFKKTKAGTQCDFCSVYDHEESFQVHIVLQQMLL